MANVSTITSFIATSGNSRATLRHSSANMPQATLLEAWRVVTCPEIAPFHGARLSTE
jgi:hypothetical protein